MYSLGGKKRDPSSNRYSIKHKTNMGQPHSHEDPGKARPPARPLAPAQPRSPMVLASGNRRPAAPAGSAGPAARGRCTGSAQSRQAQPARAGLPEGTWQRGMLCVR